MLKPLGAFYVFPQITGTGLTGQEVFHGPARENFLWPADLGGHRHTH
jgi:hypothetical protein